MQISEKGDFPVKEIFSVKHQGPRGQIILFAMNDMNECFLLSNTFIYIYFSYDSSMAGTSSRVLNERSYGDSSHFITDFIKTWLLFKMLKLFAIILNL